MAKAEEKQFTKTDMERMGIFKEMEYITIGDKYTADYGNTFNIAASKGKQVLPGGSKTRNATQAGYFTEKYDRVMEGESYSDPIKIRRQYRIKESQKNVGKPFLPSTGPKTMNGLGTFYGTLSGPMSAFNPNSRDGKAYKAPGKNFYTSPGKRGTGYGYLGVTLNGYPKYSPEAYQRGMDARKKENELHHKLLRGGAFRLNMHPIKYFEENPYRSDKPLPPSRAKESSKTVLVPFKPSSPPKKPGGNKSGTFDQYPNHSEDPYKVSFHKQVNIVNKSGKIFVPNPGPKSAPVNSIVDQNVIKAINRQNFNTLSSVMSY